MAQVEIAMSSLIAEDLFPSTSTKESWALSKTACGRAMAHAVARPSQSTGESSWIPPKLPLLVLSVKQTTLHPECGTETPYAKPLRIATALNATTQIGCPILSHSARNSSISTPRAYQLSPFHPRISHPSAGRRACSRWTYNS